ncbi:MAG: glycosyltransferase family 39 protein [Anaerolineae bacterium]|jgi:4-amino-4-deoxy-L-arabinose transferase-like glycosyltransferase|nr:glycosyltransferase family 39 protein [Anaerolineae bacterium]MDH7474296.1 glycosyltransferase family 39 protein [Anaerolineae bacterium]
MPSGEPGDDPLRTNWEWTAVVTILLVAAFFRLWALGDAPRGLEHDEVISWRIANGVLHGHVGLYFAEQGSFGHEPLFSYFMAAALALFGHNWLGVRFWAPMFGMLGISAAYALTRRLCGRSVALTMAGGMAVLVWSLFFNRLGLRLNMLLVLWCSAGYCFWRGLDTLQPGTLNLKLESPWPWFAAGGVLAGLSLYTYMASRALPLFFGAFAVYLVVFHRDRLQGRWLPLVLFFVLLVVVAAPLFLYLAVHPELEERTTQVDEPLRQLRLGNPRLILQNALALLGMWQVRGEPYWQVNVAYRPVFAEPLGAMLFYLGVILALWRWRQPRYAFLLLWLGAGLLPSLVTADAPSWPRTLGAVPAALSLMGVGAYQAWLWIKKLCAERSRPYVVTALVAILAVEAGRTYRDYLMQWPRQSNVRFTFQSSMTEAFRYLDASEDTSPVVMAGLSVHDVDPWTQVCTLRRQDLTVHWADVRQTLILPAGTDVARLIVLDITPFAPELQKWTLVGASLLAEGPMTGENRPSFLVYRLDLTGLRRQAESPPLTFATVGSDPADHATQKDLRLPVDFGGVVEFLGYRWVGELVPGGQAGLFTFWRALKPATPPLRIFLHLLDTGQNVVAGYDGLGSPPDDWRAGDILIQWHPLTLPSAGTYYPEIGWYVPLDGPRLQLQENNMVLADRLLLAPVLVAGG